MRNHFHLAVGTPKANLVLGMQWLQATFANRFNRRRSEHGHLFQSRYRALLMDKSEVLGPVCDYIHLNPVRAHIKDVDSLPEYRYSSYWYLHHPQKRPMFFMAEAVLKSAGVQNDEATGWKAYADHLAVQMANTATGKRRYLSFTQGWAIGSDAFKARIIDQYSPIGSARAWTVPGAEKMRESEWKKQMDRILVCLGRTVDEARAAAKSEPWKLAVATWMRDTVHARNKWLSKTLGLGTPAAVSRNLTRYR